MSGPFTDPSDELDSCIIRRQVTARRPESVGETVQSFGLLFEKRTGVSHVAGPHAVDQLERTVANRQEVAQVERQGAEGVFVVCSSRSS